MIVAVKWAREHKIPFLGICLGMQVAVIEWARNVCGLKGELDLASFISSGAKLTRSLPSLRRQLL